MDVVLVDILTGEKLGCYKWSLFIGQFVHPLGGDVVVWGVSLF